MQKKKRDVGALSEAKLHKHKQMHTKINEKSIFKGTECIF